MRIAFHSIPRRIVEFGSAARLNELLPAGPVLFVTDNNILDLGLATPALEALRATHPVEVFSDVEADPSRATLLEAVAMGARAGVASVVGFGGGSPMDVAKLVAYLLGSGDNLDDIWGLEKALGPRLPLVLVPTTAGTGSEVTPYSVITIEGGVKLSVNAGSLIPDVAILDAELTRGLPKHVTAATGIDAMVHAIEAYTSARLKNPLSDFYAVGALRLLAANMIRSCDNPGDTGAREAMLVGANLAGIAFSNAPVGGVHALAYPLGGLHHLPHGLANALMLRPVLEHNVQAAAALYAELADVVAPESAGEGTQGRARAFIDAMAELCMATGLELRLRDHGIAQDDVATLAADAMKGERMLVNNPLPIRESDARRIYEAAW